MSDDADYTTLRLRQHVREVVRDVVVDLRVGQHWHSSDYDCDDGWDKTTVRRHEVVLRHPEKPAGPNNLPHIETAELAVWECHRGSTEYTFEVTTSHGAYGVLRPVDCGGSMDQLLGRQSHSCTEAQFREVWDRFVAATSKVGAKL